MELFAIVLHSRSVPMLLNHIGRCTTWRLMNAKTFAIAVHIWIDKRRELARDEERSR